MMLSGNIKVALSCLLALSAAFPHRDTKVTRQNAPQSSQPLPPSQDPFYSAPAGYESSEPGTVLRIRSAPGNLTTVFNASSAAYNIVYRTTNGVYQPSWAVTTVLVPMNSTQSSNGSALLSYQIPYNTADVDAGPSYGLYSELSGGLVGSDIDAALGYGWYVNVPDFEGPSASFGSGVQEGHATLDSIRAALSSNISIPTDARYAMWGYSGGSIASEWAAELQVQYAPELNFSGMAIGGLVPNVSSTIDLIDGTPAAGLIPPLLIGLTNQIPAAYSYLTSNLKTSGQYNDTEFLAARNMSVGETFVTYTNQTVLTDYFTTGNATLSDSIIRNVIDSVGIMGYHGVPQMPVFAYKAVQDEYSSINETDELVSRYCGVGANIRYERNTAGNHLDEETNGDASALSWLQRVLSGTPDTNLTTQRCIVENVTITLSVHPPFYVPPMGISHG